MAMLPQSGGGPVVHQMQPSLKPMPGNNPATAISPQQAAGPGSGGSATAEAINQQLPQAQAAAGMPPGPPPGASVQPPAGGSAQPAVPAPAPQPGFLPNSKGEIVYQDGQGPVTEKVPEMDQMGVVSARPLGHQGLPIGPSAALKAAQSQREARGIVRPHLAEALRLGRSSCKMAADWDERLRRLLERRGESPLLGAAPALRTGDGYDNGFCRGHAIKTSNSTCSTGRPKIRAWSDNGVNVWDGLQDYVRKQEKSAFAVAFLQRCRDSGLSVDAAFEAATKYAALSATLADKLAVVVQASRTGDFEKQALPGLGAAARGLGRWLGRAGGAAGRVAGRTSGLARPLNAYKALKPPARTLARAGTGAALGGAAGGASDVQQYLETGDMRPDRMFMGAGVGAGLGARPGQALMRGGGGYLAGTGFDAMADLHGNPDTNYAGMMGALGAASAVPLHRGAQAGAGLVRGARGAGQAAAKPGGGLLGRAGSFVGGGAATAAGSYAAGGFMERGRMAEDIQEATGYDLSDPAQAQQIEQMAGLIKPFQEQAQQLGLDLTQIDPKRPFESLIEQVGASEGGPAMFHQMAQNPKFRDMTIQGIASLPPDQQLAFLQDAARVVPALQPVVDHMMGRSTGGAIMGGLSGMLSSLGSGDLGGAWEAFQSLPGIIQGLIGAGLFGLLGGLLGGGNGALAGAALGGVAPFAAQMLGGGGQQPAQPTPPPPANATASQYAPPLDPVTMDPSMAMQPGAGDPLFADPGYDAFEDLQQGNEAFAGPVGV